MCNLSKGRGRKNCADLKSGVKNLYLANYLGPQDESGILTVSGTASGHQLTDLGNITEVFQYSLKIDSAVNTLSFGPSNRNNENDVVTWAPTGTFQLNGVNAELEFQLKMMTYGTPYVFVEGRNGNLVGVGIEAGCKINYEGGFGAGMDSLNGYTLTITANESEPVFHLSASASVALKGMISTNNL